MYGVAAFAAIVYLFYENISLKNELHRDDTYLKSNDFDERFIDEVSDMRKIMYSEIENQNKAIKGNVTVMDAKLENVNVKLDDDKWDFEISTLKVPTKNITPARLPDGYTYKQCKYAFSGGSSHNDHSDGFVSSYGTDPWISIIYAASNGYAAGDSWASGIIIAFCNKNYLNPQYVNWPQEYQ